MNARQPNPGYRARVAAVIAAFAVVVSATPGLAAGLNCKAIGVGVFPGSRIHIRCNPGDGASPTVVFFALSITNPDSTRVLSLATSAVVARRTIFISYDRNDLSGAAIGCANNDCRLIQWIELLDN